MTLILTPKPFFSLTRESASGSGPSTLAGKAIMDMQPQFETIVRQIGQVVLGKKDQIRMALTCLFAGGHLLIEDIPGIGKTTLAKVLARCMGLKFRRVQFTSDMLPGDILGSSIFDQNTGTFVFHPGPVFTQVLLADEIEPGHTQNPERAIGSHGGRAGHQRRQDPWAVGPLFVIATQNPLELSGTFPLPESQLDRFLMRIELGYPDREAERLLLSGDRLQRQALSDMQQCLSPEDVLAFRKQVDRVHVAEAFSNYLQDLLDFTRSGKHFHMGLSPRAGLALMHAARSRAFISGRDYALPEDIQAVLISVAGHRLRSRDDLAEIPARRLTTLFQEVAVP